MCVDQNTANEKDSRHIQKSNYRTAETSVHLTVDNSTENKDRTKSKFLVV